MIPCLKGFVLASSESLGKPCVPTEDAADKTETQPSPTSMGTFRGLRWDGNAPFALSPPVAGKRRRMSLAPG